jgi:hypothetical protein
MHDSESIGGRLADDILSTPGLYVAIVCTWLNTGCAACGQEVDYCQGHGPIGDPAGHAIIEQHENDDHSECRECADCQDSVVEGWAVATIPDELQAFNDPRVKCCGRDAADCDCEKPDES